MRNVILVTVMLAGTMAGQQSAAQQPPVSSTAGRPETVQAVNPGGVVNINTADVKELSQLPGVSKATASKIIAHRPYSSVEDLRRSGISQKTIDRIRPLVNAAGTDRSIAKRGEQAAAKK